MLADRVDVVEGIVMDIVRLRPPNPFSEMGLRSEFRRGGFFSRFGRNRADTKRWGYQALLVGLVGAGIVLVRRNRRRKVV